MLNPNKHGHLHPGLQRAAFVYRMGTKLQILPRGHDRGTDFGFSRKMTAQAPKPPSSALVLHLPTRCQASVVAAALGWELSWDCVLRAPVVPLLRGNPAGSLKHGLYVSNNSGHGFNFLFVLQFSLAEKKTELIWKKL